MRYTLFIILFSTVLIGLGQTNDSSENESYFIMPEIIIGKTMEANDGFPTKGLQKGFVFNIGNYNYSVNKEWAVQLGFPKTGLSFAVIDYGNSEKIGRSFSMIPFLDINFYKRWNINVGMGISYMDTLYDEENNPFNRAITTHLNWSFKSFIYYELSASEKIDWRLGLGYFHHSNGHTRLPNQGLNSFLSSISAQIDLKPDLIKTIDNPVKEKTTQSFYSSRVGFGINVLSEEYNDKKPVYTIAVSTGKIVNKFLKFGAGFYYRFYQHYYDYIKDEGELVLQEYPEFMDNPFRYASNIGVYGTAELLMGHIGFEFELGFNIHKPFYPIDWKLNEGYSYENMQGEIIEVLGELDSYYKLKRAVSSRLGLKYYLTTTNKSPKHNLFLGMHINANLGQADFTDMSLGYVYRAELKNKRN